VLSSVSVSGIKSLIACSPAKFSSSAGNVVWPCYARREHMDVSNKMPQEHLFLISEVTIVPVSPNPLKACR